MIKSFQYSVNSIFHFESLTVGLSKIDNMKKHLLLVCSIILMSAAYSQQIKTPAPSPTQTIKQDFGIGSIELSYSRPGAKGRKIVGEIVPFGKVWRTGANSATIITFSDDVKIGDSTIKAGKYGLLSIPGEKEWTLIITKDLNVNSPSLYKKGNDAVRYTAKVNNLNDKVETFTMQFGDITKDSIKLDLMWEKTMVSLPITTNTDVKVMSQIENAFFKDNRPYYSAASYYYDNNKDMKQAMEWVNKAIESNAKAYWQHLLKARIALKLNDKATAKASAEKTRQLATEAKNEDYIRMANELLSSL